MTKVRTLLDIPDQVRKMDFTVTLTEGVAHPQQTVSSYVVTPRLADAFDHAIGLVHGAMRDARSQASYLHGSFGSGKSHFMALLSLLLADDETAWSRPELHHLRAKYDWIGTKKPLQLQLHMLGKESLEGAIYPAYLEYLDKHHPGAPVPGLFADADLFDNAADTLASMGDAAFFAPMNAGLAADDDADWGTAVASGRWDRVAFDDARKSTDPARRRELLDVLLRTHFKAFRTSARSFKDLDEGLHELTRHAASLGYGAVVLYLDELILRMSMGASDPKWLAEMVQGMVKLVESTHSDRPLPVVSFIARQRDLSEMVGDQLAGAENARLRDMLNHAQGRIGQIDLHNEDLPAIVEKRVLKAKDAAAAKQITTAFDEMKRAAGNAWNTLTAGSYDAAEFRKLYPFSPALVEALVALSSSLQRQRTSIKLLTEILVEHIEDLELGDLVGVGDLFDVLATGDESAQGIMRERFRAALHLYRHELLPMIQETNGTTTPAVCQRLRDDHPVRLGCSNCPQLACRNDNRLVKTLLVGALVPNSNVLRDLTAKRLVELNHGKLKTPIPGQEWKIAAGKLRRWAGQLGQLHVGEQADPQVSIELHGVDLKPIFEQARSADSLAKRQLYVRDLLFEAMGVGKDSESGVDTTVTWRQSKRVGHVRFGNVRRMSADVLRCPEGHDWRLVVDFPFDEPGHGPKEDEGVLEEFREHESSWTLVWLPTFFSKAVNDTLGELVVLGHILDAGKAQLQNYIGHLSLEQQDMAITSMRNLQSQKRAQVFAAMRKAYGLDSSKPDDRDLDPSQRVDKHLHTLQAGLDIQPTLASDLAKALERYVPASLEERYPRHPDFRVPLSSQRLDRVLRFFDDLVDRDDRKLPLDKDGLEDMRGVLGELGFVRTTETAAILRTDGTLQDIEQRRLQKAIDHPTAADVAAWYDPDGKSGLMPEVMAVVVRAYARAMSRTLVHGGGPFPFKPGKPIPGGVVLEKPELPSAAEWSAALEEVGHLFGLTLPGKALHGDNLKLLHAKLREQLDALGPWAGKLVGVLGRWYQALGVPDDSPRRTTALSAETLVATLQGQPAVAQIRALAQYEAKTSRAAVGRSLAHGKQTHDVLDASLVLGVFQQLAGMPGNPEAVHLLEQARIALRKDEVNETLSSRIRQLAEEGQRLVMTPAIPALPAGTAKPSSTGKVVLDQVLQAHGRTAALAAMTEALEAVRRALESGADVVLTGSIRVTTGAHGEDE